MGYRVLWVFAYGAVAGSHDRFISSFLKSFYPDLHSDWTRLHSGHQRARVPLCLQCLGWEQPDCPSAANGKWKCAVFTQQNIIQLLRKVKLGSLQVSGSCWKQSFWVRQPRHTSIISFLSLAGVSFESPDMYIPLGIPRKVRKLVQGLGWVSEKS